MEFKCKECNKELINKKNKFCNNTCAAYYNNRNSKKLKECKRGPDQILDRLENCLCCGKKLKPTSRKYCNNSCRAKYVRDEKIKKWLNGDLSGTTKYGHGSYVKVYLLEKYDYKCSLCGWNETNPYSGNIPLEIEHIDGNAYNNDPSNVTLLCPNCQALTKTYRGLNIGNGRRSYLKKYYMKDLDGNIIG